VRPRRIVIGQKVSEAKLQQARKLRRAMTAEEKALWERLRANRLNGLHFRRQQVIDGFIVDFYCHSAGLAVELDGGVHATRADADAQRDSILSRRGVRVLRISNDEVQQDMDSVLARIAAAAEQGTPDRSMEARE